MNAWQTGLTAAVTITNTRTAPVDGWSLAFTLPAGQAITSGWGATFGPASGPVTARPLGHTTTIGPSASVGVGFQATHTGGTGEPASFTLNGNECAVS